MNRISTLACAAALATGAVTAALIGSAADSATASGSYAPAVSDHHYDLGGMPSFEVSDTYRLPTVPSGTYLATVHLVARVSGPDLAVRCELSAQPGQASPLFGQGTSSETYLRSGDYESTLTLSGAVGLSGKSRPALSCRVSGKGTSMRIEGLAHNSVDLVPVVAHSQRVAPIG